jgi:hypothetical protein
LVQYNGTVGWPSPYAPKKGVPTPEIDAAWNALGGIYRWKYVFSKLTLDPARPMSVSEEVVLRSGETTDAVRLPKEFGGGYLAWAEVNHQLHCLNLMRKAIYWDYYVEKEHEFQRERSEVFWHLGTVIQNDNFGMTTNLGIPDHCVEMLRQILMCNADTGVQLHHWVKGNPTPIPNSNTWHQCKNFDSILKWTQDNQLPEFEYLPQLPGSKVYNEQP